VTHGDGTRRLGDAMRRVTAAIAGLAIALGSLATGATAAAQGRQGGQGRGGGAAACTTLACDVQGDWERTRQLLIGVAEAMPDDKYNYKPTPAQQTFGERLMHVAQIDVKLLSTLGGKTPAPTLNAQAASKADVIAALRQSFDYGAAVLKEFNDQQLIERVTSLPFLGPTASRARVVNFSMQHTQDIYGQLVVYLRLNDITPPASARQPA
jgi:uncharacterized damage-inducible protein DinB